MGTCMKKASDVSLDGSVLIQRRLGLNSIHFREFSERIQAKEQEHHINYNQLKRIFQDNKFGQNLADPRNCEIKALMRYPLFTKEGNVSSHALLCLGAIYAKGTIIQKAQILWDTFDSNGDHLLYIPTIKQIFQNIITIAGVIMPSLDKHAQGKGQAINQQSVPTLCDSKLMVFFKNQIHISKDRFIEKVQSDFRFDEPIQIRKMLQEIEIESEHSELA